ncbi:MAG TPA: bifunctional ADP-dependent NAD(P)H-hydrate dehydratase/NAD(P)H-hydrate epimerase, partial [Firmicutes bacterium]|nr:bifunctional ADP-dependent NAD(P)H-hydrate dehydratase/NAD(P)H-hydrate epimerase [Bacillota bacterium]
LAGMIGGLLAQGVVPVQAAVAGVYLHGKAGDLAAAEIGTTGLLAGDLLPRIPRTLR